MAEIPSLAARAQSASTAFPNALVLRTSSASRPGKPHLFGQCDQFVGFGNVAPVDIVGPKNGLMEFFPFPFALRPFAQLGGEPAVVGHRSLPERQPQLRCRPLLAGLHLAGIEIQARIELIQGKPLLRGVGVEGKGLPLDFNLEVLTQLFNTPGTEVAPGSDVIRKDLKNFGRRHVIPPISFVFLSSAGPLPLPAFPAPPRTTGRSGLYPMYHIYKMDDRDDEQASVPTAHAAVGARLLLPTGFSPCGSVATLLINRV